MKRVVGRKKRSLIEKRFESKGRKSEGMKREQASERDSVMS